MPHTHTRSTTSWEFLSVEIKTKYKEQEGKETRKNLWFGFFRELCEWVVLPKMSIFDHICAEFWVYRQQIAKSMQKFSHRATWIPTKLLIISIPKTEYQIRTQQNILWIQHKFVATRRIHSRHTEYGVRMMRTPLCALFFALNIELEQIFVYLFSK